MRTGGPATQVEELLNEMNVDTLNLRIFWQDHIVTRDHKIMQSILATGFSDFAKGPVQDLRFVLHPSDLRL